MDNKNFDLFSVSRARGLILFAATLMVLVFHSSFQFQQPVIAFLISSGYMGVDLFLFVSGLGLFFSFSKNPDIKAFYARRALRILPAFLIVAVIWNLIHYPGSIKSFLENVLLISFYKNGDRTFWYFALIIPLYFVYPLIHIIIEKYRHWAAISMILSVAAISFILTKKYWQFSLVEIAFTRIPVFICGVWLAPYVKSRKTISRSWLWLCIVVLLLGNIVLFLDIVDQITVQRFICCPIAVSWALLLSSWNEHLHQGRFYRILVWIGSLSLELYLVQERLLSLVATVFPSFDHHNIILNLCVYPLSLFSAYILHLICRRITEWSRVST